MKLLKAFRAGIRKAVQAWPAALIVLIVNLVFAGIAALLFKSALASAFGNSLAPEQFIDGFNFSYFMDLTRKNPGFLNSVFGLVVWMIIVHNFLFLFFYGGIIKSVQPNSEKITLQSFFAGCGEFFGRFFRLFLIFVLISLGLVFVLGIGAGFLFSTLQGDGETEMQIMRAAGSVVALFTLSFSILLLIVDYARVITVAENERKMFQAFWFGVKFVFRRFFSAYGLFILFTIGNLLILGGSVFIGIKIDANDGLAFLGSFILQQVLVMFRAWWRTAAIGGQVELYDSFKLVTEVGLNQENSIQFFPEPVQSVVTPVIEPTLNMKAPLVAKRTTRRVPRKKVVAPPKKKIAKRRQKKAA